MSVFAEQGDWRVGDRVRVTNTKWSENGKLGTIKEIRGRGWVYPVLVTMDRDGPLACTTEFPALWHELEAAP